MWSPLSVNTNRIGHYVYQLAPNILAAECWSDNADYYEFIGIFATVNWSTTPPLHRYHVATSLAVAPCHQTPAKPCQFVACTSPRITRHVNSWCCGHHTPLKLRNTVPLPNGILQITVPWNYNIPQETRARGATSAVHCGDTNEEERELRCIHTKETFLTAESYV
jgi:hypothetical protein